MPTVKSLERMAWRKLNPEKDRDSFRRYYARHRDELLVMARARYLKNRTKRITYAIAWNKAHPEQRSRTMVFQNAKRRSRIKANGGRGFMKAHWTELLRRSNGLCVYCRQQPADSIDHHIPISKGGQHDWFNIVPACRLCNSRKRENHPWVWIPKNFGLMRWNEIEAIKLSGEAQNFMNYVFKPKPGGHNAS